MRASKPTYSHVPFESLQRFDKIGPRALLMSPFQPAIVSGGQGTAKPGPDRVRVGRGAASAVEPPLSSARLTESVRVRPSESVRVCPFVCLCLPVCLLPPSLVQGSTRTSSGPAGVGPERAHKGDVRTQGDVYTQGEFMYNTHAPPRRGARQRAWCGRVGPSRARVGQGGRRREVQGKVIGSCRCA